MCYYHVNYTYTADLEYAHQVGFYSHVFISNLLKKTLHTDLMQFGLEQLIFVVCSSDHHLHSAGPSNDGL